MSSFENVEKPVACKSAILADSGSANSFVPFVSLVVKNSRLNHEGHEGTRRSVPQKSKAIFIPVGSVRLMMTLVKEFTTEC